MSYKNQSYEDSIVIPNSQEFVKNAWITSTQEASHCNSYYEQTLQPMLRRSNRRKRMQFLENDQSVTNL